MEILRLKGVPFSRLEVYKEGGGGSSFMERGPVLEIFYWGAGRHEFFLLVFKGSYHKYLFLQM